MEGSCECGNELSVSIKLGEILEYLGACYLLQKDCAVSS